MRRRSFLQQLAAGGAALAGASTPYALARVLSPVETTPAPHPRRLRPPGALAEADFIAACIGCGLCGEVCPPGAIRFYGREGGDKINTPYIDPVITACTLTGDCMKVCPTNALLETPREKVRMGIAQIDRTACYPWVDRGVCGACVPICPLGPKAIDFAFANLYRPVVKEGCVGCGICVEVCPHPLKPIQVVAHELAEFPPVIQNYDVDPPQPQDQAESAPTSPPGLLSY